MFQAVLNSTTEEKFNSTVRAMKDPAMVAQLYFCGTLEKPHRCQDILSKGFAAEGKK